MPLIKNRLKWCLKEENRLKIVSKNQELALKHLKKSENNFVVLEDLEKLGYKDWALTVGFYCVYHCFLAILSKEGYKTKNQTCTITTMLYLIKNKRINFQEDLVLKFDTLEPEKNLSSSTLRTNRETATYGVETSIDSNELKNLKTFIINVQKETIKNLF